MNPVEFFLQLVNIEWVESNISQHPISLCAWALLWFFLGYLAANLLPGAKVLMAFIVEKNKAKEQCELADKAMLDDACSRIVAMDWIHKDFLLDIRNGEYSRVPSHGWELSYLLPDLRGLVRTCEFAPDIMRVELTELGERACQACPDALNIERDIAD